MRASLQGRGLATKAAGACRQYAAETLRLDDLIAITDPRNTASQRVAKKIGLQAAWQTATRPGRPCVMYAADPRAGDG